MKPLEKIFRTSSKLCIPLNVTFEITLRCNIRCVHCYNFDRDLPVPRERTGSELRPDEVMRIIEEVREAGCLFISFTGGEAVMHPNIYDYIGHARKQNLSVVLLTNGTLLNETTVNKLVDAEVSKIKISMYGATPQTHDAFTQVPGSFEQTLQGAKKLKQQNLYVTFSYCVVQQNAHEIEDMITLSDQIDIPCTFDTSITSRNDGDANPVNLRTERENLKNIHQGPLRKFLLEPDHNPEKSVQCTCARTNCGISSTGEVYPCMAAPLPSGNLREKSFADIWNNSPQLNRIRQLTLDDFETCKPCPHRPYCRRSSGAVYSTTGHYTGPEEFTCMEAEVIHEIYDNK